MADEKVELKEEKEEKEIKEDEYFPAFDDEELVVEEDDPEDRPVFLQDHLWKMCQKKELTDVTFIVGEGRKQQKFYAHKLVLASASPLFEAMLYEDPAFEDEKESKESKESKKEVAEPENAIEIKLPKQDTFPFEALLRCIYTDKVDVDADNISGLIAVATKYQVEKLRVQCADFMERDVTLENVCSLFEIAPTLLGKPDFGFPFIREHTQEVLNSEGFLNLSKHRVSSILEDDKLNVEEIELFNAILKWGDAESKRTGRDRKELLGDLIPYIRFPTMPVNKIAGPVNASGLLSPDQLLSVFQYVSTSDEKKKEAVKLVFSKKPRQEGKKTFLVTWDPSQSFTNGLYVVTNNGHTARKATSDGTIYILRATRPLEAKGKHYWEIFIDTLVATNDVQIGAAIPSYSWTSAWLQGAGSYYIDRTGACYEGTTWRFATSALATGDRIGFFVDYKKNTLEFWRGKGKKGGKMQIIGSFSSVSQPLYPVLAARPVGNVFSSV
jgi:hypothetical protein